MTKFLFRKAENAYKKVLKKIFAFIIDFGSQR